MSFKNNISTTEHKNKINVIQNHIQQSKAKQRQNRFTASLDAPT